MMARSDYCKSILIIDDDKTFNALMLRQLKALGFDAAGARSLSQANGFLSEKEPDLILLDIRLPDANGAEALSNLSAHCPVIILTAYGSIEQAVEAMKAGASEYLTKPVNLEELKLTIERTLDTDELRRSFQFARTREREQAGRRSYMRGRSKALKNVRRLIDAIAPESNTVLITGESGVGKELVAREIHEQSKRADRNFVALDCCTLQENLFESELFGHERGSFTGADRQKKGLIEGAEGGTLFLDEIGEIGPAIQAKLLRILETGIFRRLGGNKDLHANTRILAATNRDLETLAREGSFRSDLYYRLSAFNINMPPLRERREDIPDLVNHFINNHDFSRPVHKNLTDRAIERLTGYDWPGNVRELKNVIERAIILSGDAPVIRRDHLGLDVKGNGPASVLLEFTHEPTLEDIKKSYLEVLLERYNGHRARISERLGISERNVYRLIRKFEL